MDLYKNTLFVEAVKHDERIQPVTRTGVVALDIAFAVLRVWESVYPDQLQVSTPYPKSAFGLRTETGKGVMKWYTY